jgi:hypothetical protein
MNNKINPTISIQLETRMEIEKKIIRLINSYHYCLRLVFIVFEGESCRLVVYRKDEIVIDQSYKTVKGAKIAFLKFFSFMAHNEKIMPKWTHIYTPEKNWLEQRLK